MFSSWQTPLGAQARSSLVTCGIPLLPSTCTHHGGCRSWWHTSHHCKDCVSVSNMSSIQSHRAGPEGVCFLGPLLGTITGLFRVSAYPRGTRRYHKQSSDCFLQETTSGLARPSSIPAKCKLLEKRTFCWFCLQNLPGAGAVP